MNLLSHNVRSLEGALAALGEPALHATRILRRFYGHHGRPDWADPRLGRRLRALLEAAPDPNPTRILERVESDDGTLKLLLGLSDGATAEAVLMPSYREEEASACVSTQVGCAMRCDFCATTRGGLVRNLEGPEIVGQFLHLGAEAQERGRALKRLVFMGMGEPLNNLDAVLFAIERIASPALGALGWRRITVSTVGLVPELDRLTALGLGVHLAVSLHAADDALRGQIVPTAKRFKVADIVAAARRFQERRGRIVTFSYCLLADVNDRDADADALADVLDGSRSHVNVIPYNAIGAGLSGVVYARPSAERVEHFVERLRARGVVAHVRDARGDDVSAACGQLRERRGPHPFPSPPPLRGRGEVS
ncbi:MAG: 23S rRNA (adenine(2503)-C(2))-methyltransferase [Deltaproteobacteria bacterium CG2_30_63_29]|nr:MAG: 23S rRNA (adenine(2503)-C(2))-methyltransferase [Deltaproteobacteria bacterium CG2_30_63_29]PJB33803.1 MAG: 23S rRNA (adenine(2503)-C(2))-methyltransferase RlmN [Deltaproteobacteria bacterium CG_4_9_14_3_um_filter_63_12]